MPHRSSEYLASPLEPTVYVLCKPSWDHRARLGLAVRCGCDGGNDGGYERARASAQARGCCCGRRRFCPSCPPPALALALALALD